MNNILQTTLIGLFFGTFGTTIGGIIGICIKKNSNRFLSFILSFASGLMLAIVCFDLIPEAMKIANTFSVLIGIIFGIIVMIICDVLVQNKFNNNRLNFKKSKKTKMYLNTNNIKTTNINLNNSLLKTGIAVSIGLALHNLPEGLAIGSGFGASLKLGYSLAIAICLHDIPEGISMAVPMKNGGISPIKVVFYVVLSGITTGIGAFLGAIVRWYITKYNIYMFKLCSRSNAIYSFWRINSRIK